MGVPDIPDDLAAFLRIEPLTLEAGHYETVALVPLADLRIETLELTPNMAPFAQGFGGWPPRATLQTSS